MTHYLIVFYMLGFGHVLADFALTTSFFSIHKNHKIPHPHIKETIWGWLLNGHAWLHGGMVFIMTGNIWLGLTEHALHALTDYAKSAGWINFHADQTIHLLCKALYVVLAMTGVVTLKLWYMWFLT